MALSAKPGSLDHVKGEEATPQNCPLTSVYLPTYNHTVIIKVNTHTSELIKEGDQGLVGGKG